MKLLQYIKYSFLLILVNFINIQIGNSQTLIFSTNQGISVANGGTFTYCIGDPVDLIFNNTPGNKIFAGNGITDLGTSTPATANFDPAAAGLGAHTITYFSKNWTFVVTNPGAVNLAAFADNEYCENEAAFALTGGTPSPDPTGTYWVDGVAAVQFNPATVGVGVHNIMYSIGSGTCIVYSAPQIITVYAVTPATLTLTDPDVCINDAQFALSGGGPVGGVYSAPLGVVGGTDFDPATAGLGAHTITYTYTNAAGCVSPATDVITVHALPVVKAVTKTDYCQGATGGTLTIANSAVGVNYSLYRSPSNAFVETKAGTAANLLFNTGLLAGDYYFVATDIAAGCSVTYGINTIIENPLPLVSLTLPVGDDAACINRAAYVLTGGLPGAGGSYSGLGVVLGSFDPAAAGGAGIKTITYSYTDVNSCTNTATDNITVYALPVVTLTIPAANQQVCIDEATFALSGGLPAGGTYLVDGVPNANFNPAAEGAGVHVISYSYTNVNGCTNSTTANITVNDLPIVGFINLVPVIPGQCDSDPINNLVGNQAGGTFTGNGITDLGGGNAQFNPATSGLGLHNITYSYTDINGCTSSDIQQTRVGTLIFINGLGSNYCQGDADVNFTYSHWVNALTDGVASAPVAAAVTDPDDGFGNATFHPTLAGAGIHVVTYNFTDDIGCINTITQNVQVALGVTANFSGLNATLAYCEGAGNVLLTGNYAPGGTFTGPPGSLVDNGNGTATFSPSVLPVGGPYTITYSYTNASGCVDTESKNITILQAPTGSIAGNATICAGNNTPLTITMTGGALYDFTYTDGFSSWNVTNVASPNIINVTPIASRVYTLTNVAYHLGAPNSCAVAGTGSATIVVNPQSVITVQPVDAEICETNNATFTVTATGQNLTYQWYFNNGGGPVALGTSASQAVNNVDALDEGDYYCEVSSSCGPMLTTNNASLTVLPTTSITSHPAGATKCTNGSISFTTLATGSNLVFQWQKGGVNVADILPKISGSNTNILTINTLLAADAGSYTCIVTGDCGTETSNPAVLVVNAPIAITTQPTNKTACAGDNLIYNITATGTNLSYQWKFDDGVNPIVNLGIASSQPVNGVLAANVGTYYCVVTSPCGASITSAPATLTLNTPTAIATNPTGSLICQGGTKTFSVVASGSNLTYLWYKDGVPLADGGTISGSALTNLTIAGVVPGNAGNYRCLVTGDCGFLWSTAATLTVEQAVTFNSQPADLTVCPASDATFSVNVNGTNLIYDWEYNTATLGAASSPNYTRFGVVGANAGNYRCKISNACGITYSNEVQLIVNTTTAISAQPIDETACETDNVAFSVTASGTNLTYSWLKGGIAIAPAETNSTLDIFGLVLADAGSYTCAISGACGNTVSAPGILTIEEIPTIGTQPQSATDCPGVNTNITVILATGSNITYQWYFDNGGGFLPVGVNSPIYNIPAFAAGNEGDYYCEITNNCGTIVTNTVTRTLGVITSIGIQPIAVIKCANGNANFTVTATGSNLTYQWRKNGVNLVDNARIIGSSTNNLSINGLLITDADNYSCRITGSCTSVTSNSAALTINEPVAITLDPSDDEICEGDNASFSITATGTGLSYQWYHNLVAIPLASGTSYTITGAVLADAGDYYCEVTNTCGTESSNTATLIVNENITIPLAGQPAAVSNCEGALVSFVVAPTAGTNLTYRWRKDGVDIFDGGTISGAATNTLTINGILPGDAADYSCFVSNGCDFETSFAATLAVSEAVAITSQPQTQTGCSGDPINLVTIATGTNLNYQWYKDGVLMAGETNPVLAIAAYITGVDDGVYFCEITNGCGITNSNDAILTDGNTTVIVTDPTSAERCEGGTVSFVVAATGTNLTYQWQKDGVDLNDNLRITATNTNTLSITGILFTDLGEYTCNVFGDCNNVTSAGATLTVRRPPVITSQPVSDTVCNLGMSNFAVVVTGDNLTYSWQRNSIPLGIAASSLTINPATAANEGIYNCVISTAACGLVTSAAADLVVYDNLVINTQPLTQTSCEGNNISFNVALTGPDIISRQWFKDGLAIANGGQFSGAKSDILGITSITAANQGAYYVSLTSRCGSFASNIANLNIDENVSITVNPTSFSVLIGNTANFTVVATGDITGYQWRKDGIDLVDGGDISGALTAALSIANTNDTDEGNYTCSITGPCVDAVSNPAVLTVLATSLITTHPATPVVKCEGETLNLSIVSTATTFEWRTNGIALIEGGDISGSNTPNLTVSNLIVADQGTYTCFVDGVESSQPSVVTVNPATTISVQPISADKCVNDNIVFAVTASGGALTYQWQKNNANILGATNNTYIINPLVDGDDGSYHCIVSGTCGIKPSDPATLVVNINTAIATHPVNSTICQNGSTTLSIVATGENLTYQWFKDGNPMANGGTISGALSKDLVISNALITDAGVYSCEVQGDCLTQNSNSATVIVNPQTLITVHPINRTVCAGNNVTFTVSADGAISGYQWYKGAAPIALATNSSYTINGVAKTDEGSFYCVVSGTCGNATSNPAVLKVNTVTAINTQPAGNTICETGSLALNFNVLGDNLIYQWNKDGNPVANGASLSGVTTADLAISNALTTDAGVYTCSVTGACGDVNSNTAQVLVNSATKINTHPQSAVRCVGDNVSFTTIASGTNLTYRWQRNGANLSDGVNISGSLTATLNISNLAALNAGDYTCVVTGDCNILTSNPAVLIINALTAITTQPAPVTICQNTSTTLTVVASGTNLAYQWKFNGNVISDGGNYLGTLTSSLLISNAQLVNGGTYSCKVSGTCSTENSQPALITILPATSVANAIQDKTRCTGDIAIFSVNAQGASITYQWKLNNVDIAGATAFSYTINPVALANAGSYSCAIGGTCGTVTSNPGVLTVQTPPTINTQPTDISICAENTASFLIGVTGTNVTYQWQKNGTNITDGGTISGTSTDNLEIDLASNANEGLYSCNLQGTCGNSSTNAVLLTVYDSTLVTLQPTSLTIVLGSDAFFNISATGNALTYQWQKNGVNLINGANIAGVTTSLLSVTNIAATDAGSYRCVVTGSCGIKTSQPGFLTVNVPVTISTNPVDQTKCVGESVSFSVTGAGTGLTYQWKLNGTNLTDNGVIAGAMSSNLIISSVQLIHAGTYSCLVSGNYGTANSLGALLTINGIVSINQQPATQTLCENDNLILEAIASGAGLTYQWTKNNLNVTDNASISGSNASMLIVTNVSSADAGTYRCTITNACNNELTDPAVVTINPNVAFTTQPASLVKCEKQTANFAVVASGVNVQYQWYKSGVALVNNAKISGAQTANLIITNLVLADMGNYSCYISDNCSSANSSVAVLSMNQTTQINTQPDNIVLCELEDASFEVLATGYNIAYKWQKDGTDLVDGGDIFGSDGSVLIIRNVSASDAGNYRCNITGGCSNELTNPASLTVKLLPVAAGSISGDIAVCQGELGILYTVPQVANATSYVWDLPYGATIVSGNGTRSIRVDYADNAQSGSVSVHGQNSCGNGAESAAIGVTVNALPIAIAGINQLVCGTTTNLAANAVTGTWSILSGDAVISDVTLYNSAISLLKKGENEFIWTVTKDGCVARDTVSITNTSITVNAGDDQVVCSKSANLHAFTPATGAVWSIVTGAGNISNLTNPISQVTGLSQGINQFSWVVNNQGCISSDTVTINNDLPLLPKGGQNQVVESDLTSMDAEPTEAGTTGKWSVLSGSGSFVDSSDPKTKVTNLSPGVNILLWAVQRNNCILGDTVLIENIAIENPEAGPNQTICNNFTELEATSPEIGTGEWSVILGAATFVDKYSNTSKVTNIGTGSNWLKWTVRTSGLGMEYDSVLITNNQATIANAGSDVILCANTFTLNANSPINGSGAWILTSGSGNISSLTDPKSAILNLGQGVNELKWTITNANCVTEDFVKITNNLPTTAIAGDDQTICYDSTVLIPNTPNIGSGSWSIISGAGTFNVNTVTQLAPDNNTLRYTITKGTCMSFDDVIITNNMPTTPDAGYDQKICTDTLVLGANQALQGLGVWSVISGAGTFSNTSLNNATVTKISNGINIYRWTITKNSCEAQDELSVSNNFISATAGTDVSICSSEYQLLASNPSPGKGTWSIVGSSGAVFKNQNSANSLVTNLSNGNNQLRWTVNNLGCISSDDVIVSNYNPTEATAGENQSVCGKEAELGANTAIFGDGLWVVMSGAGTFDDASNPKTTIRSLGEGQNTLRWLITEGECISYDEIIIQSNLPENVFAGNDQIACSDTAVLSAVAPTLGKGQWSIIKGSGNFDNPSVHNTTIRKLGRGENILKWMVSSSDCHVPDTVVISSNIPTKSVAGADQILCVSNTVMAANIPIVGTGQWDLVSGSAVIARLTDPKTSITDIALGNTTLRWTISEKGCFSASELTLINNQPSQPFAGYDFEICADSVRLFATPVEIGDGRWTLVSGDAVVITPDSNQTQVQNIKFNDNTFRWTVTHKNCVLSDDIIVTNNYEYVNAGIDRQVNTPNVQLVANKPSKGIGEWRVSASPAFIETIDNFETMVTGLGSGANVFTWTITNNGCTSSDDIIINYVVMPVADFNPSAVKGCPPMLVNFVNTSIGGEPYSWDFGDGEISTEHSLWHVYNEPGIYKAVLTAQAPLGLTVSKDTFITVYEIPTANFEIAPDTIYIPGEHISCFNYSLDAEISQWFFGDGTYITEYAPIYSYTEEGIYDVTLKVTSNEGCVDSMTIENAVEVLPRSDFFFPEAFTPNLSGGAGGAYDPTDRSNDVFYPIIIDGGLDEYELIIYNRLGVILFQTNDINIGWDGYYKNKMQPQDVYVFIVQGRYNNGQPFKIMGNVLLIVKEN